MNGEKTGRMVAGGAKAAQGVGRIEPAGQSGFSLIEILIATLVLSVGVLAVCGMQISGLNGNAAGRQYTAAAALAMDKMEALLALPYESLVDDDGDDATAAANYGLYDATATTADYSETDASGQYTIYWNVAEDLVVANTKTVSVIVMWNGVGMQRSVSLQCVMPEIT